MLVCCDESWQCDGYWNELTSLVITWKVVDLVLSVVLTRRATYLCGLQPVVGLSDS